MRVVHIPRAIWKANFCALLFVAVDRFGHTRWEYFTRWLCVAGALKKSCKTFGKYKMEACSTATVRDTHGQPNRSPIIPFLSFLLIADERVCLFPACGPNFNKNELENSCSRDGNFLVRFRRVDIQIEIEFTVIDAYRHTLRTTITGYTRLSRKEERPIDNAFQNKKERRVKYTYIELRICRIISTADRVRTCWRDAQHLSLIHI